MERGAEGVSFLHPLSAGATHRARFSVFFSPFFLFFVSSSFWTGDQSCTTHGDFSLHFVLPLTPIYNSTMNWSAMEQ
jgi:hypothetical protein